ncbi:uncharacterized protein LOC142984602 [Anticarsia gemmatalis]|uniref:uncharacterized protein LOC142984602 n=1 Tax=Anticarsia gemmatalis TaxID=129554 RepID=UPI003F76137A
MQQPVPQHEQLGGQAMSQQMVLCPVRLVYETQILVQPGDQISPNQTFFINPQNPPPWMQNSIQRQPLQNQVVYVHQLPNNIVQQVQQPIDQNQLYIQQNFNYPIQQPMLGPTQDVRSMQLANIVPNMVQNLQGLERNQNGQIQNVRPVQNQIVNQNVELQRQVYMRPQMHQQNLQRPVMTVNQMPMQQQITNMPNVGTNVGQTGPNVGQTYSPRPPMRANNVVNVQPVVKVRENTPEPKTVNSPIGNVVPNVRNFVPNYYRPIQPRPQLVQNVANSPKMQHIPVQTVQNSPVYNHEKNSPNGYIIQQLNSNRKRKSESPDEIQKKMAALKPNFNSQSITVTKLVNEIGTNTSPVHRPKGPQFSQMNKNLENSTESKEMQEKEKLIRNTVFTQARGRVLQDKIEEVKPMVVDNATEMAKPGPNVGPNTSTQNVVIPNSGPNMVVPITSGQNVVLPTSSGHNPEQMTIVQSGPIKMGPNDLIRAGQHFGPIQNFDPNMRQSIAGPMPGQNMVVQMRAGQHMGPINTLQNTFGLINPGQNFVQTIDRQNIPENIQIRQNVGPIMNQNMTGQNIMVPGQHFVDPNSTRRSIAGPIRVGPSVEQTQVQIPVKIQHITGPMNISQNVEASKSGPSVVEAVKPVQNVVEPVKPVQTVVEPIKAGPIEPIKAGPIEAKVEKVGPKTEMVIEQPKVKEIVTKNENKIIESKISISVEEIKTTESKDTPKVEAEPQSMEIVNKDSQIKTEIDENKKMEDVENIQTDKSDKIVIKQENINILTHVVDGYVIQESNFAFPIRKPLKEKTIHPNTKSLKTEGAERDLLKECIKEELTSNHHVDIPLLPFHYLLLENKEEKNEQKAEEKKEECVVLEDKVQEEKVVEDYNGDPFAKLQVSAVKSWTVEDLSNYLLKYNWKETVSLLQDHEIDGESLFLVSKQQLITIGVSEEHADVICEFVKS